MNVRIYKCRGGGGWVTGQIYRHITHPPPAVHYKSEMYTYACTFGLRPIHPPLYIHIFAYSSICMHIPLMLIHVNNYACKFNCIKKKYQHLQNNVRCMWDAWVNNVQLWRCLVIFERDGLRGWACVSFNVKQFNHLNILRCVMVEYDTICPE